MNTQLISNILLYSAFLILFIDNIVKEKEIATLKKTIETMNNLYKNLIETEFSNIEKEIKSDFVKNMDLVRQKLDETGELKIISPKTHKELLDMMFPKTKAK